MRPASAPGGAFASIARSRVWALVRHTGQLRAQRDDLNDSDVTPLLLSALDQRQRCHPAAVEPAAGTAAARRIADDRASPARTGRSCARR
jgi:hypothetical protein